MDYIDRIAALGACAEALRGLRAARHPDLATAWAACRRPDWLLWLAGRCAAYGSTEHRAVVTAAAGCVAGVLDIVPAGDERPRAAVETAQAWAQGGASIHDCVNADPIDESEAADADAAFAAEAAACAVTAAYLSRADERAAAAANAVGYAQDAGADPAHLLALVRRHLPAPPTLSE